LPLSAAEGDALLGLWATGPADDPDLAHVRISKEGETYAGAIVWLAEPIYGPDDEQGMGGQPKVDRENPDPELKKRPIIGLPLVEGFSYAGKNRWKGGTIYDPNNGKTYSCKLKLNGDVLKVRGYIGVSLIGRTTQWTRVAEE
jgi:uncharacterized protein (DUF2147 family)